MTGNTLAEFMDDLLTMGGPEKEFLFRNKRYFLQTQTYEHENTLIELVTYECFGNENYIYSCHGKTFYDCVHQFEQAPIFDNMTIYEAESEIQVLFG